MFGLHLKTKSPEIVDKTTRPKIVIKSNLLDQQQLDAILDKNRTQLVIAGAGAGKTTTLVGKLKYLVEIKKVNIDEILIISYSNNTVNELKNTVCKELGADSDKNIMTIHALGNRILRTRKEYVDDNRLNLIFGKTLDIIKDEYYAKCLINHICAMTDFPFTDYSLKNEYMPIFTLRSAANVLLRDDVEYSYFRSNSINGKTYPPTIVIQNGTKKIYLKSTDSVVRDSFKEPEKLIQFLKNEGVETNHLSDVQFAKKLMTKIWKLKLANNIGGYISRFKSTQTTMDFLRKSNINQNSGSKMQKIDGRLDLLEKIMQEYTEDYVNEEYLDYEDMIIEATKDLNAGFMPNQIYKYVLVDEYQDVSRIIVDLLYALRKCMDFDMFCVGDDWQSIYSFSGGDIGQMYDFENKWKEWGNVGTFKIETTYRSPSEILDVTNRFIMKNRSQIRKTMHSYISTSEPPIVAISISDQNEIAEKIAKELHLLPDDCSVFIIGRTRYDVTVLNDNDNFEVPKIERDDAKGTLDIIFKKKIHKGILDKKITYLTAHSSKGLEADYIFLLVDKNKKCFPLTVTDDISKLFPTLNESIDEPEERRLFYVAMTRTKKKLFMIIKNNSDETPNSRSPFGKEIIVDNPKYFKTVK